MNYCALNLEDSRAAAYTYIALILFNLDIKHLTEGAKNINDRLRAIESEQRELEAIMNEAVSKPLAGETDYSDEGKDFTHFL